MPQGAVEISRDETDEGLAVTFNASGEWAGVKTHFDSQFAKLGFDRNPEKDRLYEQLRSKHPDWNEQQLEAGYKELKTKLANIAGPSAEYGAANGATAILMDMHKAKASAPSQDGKLAEMGDYTLIFPK